MSLFRLDASIRVDGSASREIADIVEIPGGLLAVGRRWSTDLGHPVPQSWLAVR